jgi:hypothetical protein
MTGYRSKVKMAENRWIEYDHPYSVRLSAETADGFFRDILRQNYYDHIGEVYILENKEELMQWEAVDLIDTKKRLDALKVLIKYYFTESEYNQILDYQYFDQDEEDEYELSLLRTMKEMRK